MQLKSATRLPNATTPLESTLGKGSRRVSLRWALPPLALAFAALLILPGDESLAFSLLGSNLDLDHRDVRFFGNFNDSESNDNTTTESEYPGAVGLELALWKGVAEWGSVPHGDGSGDPTQTFIGSGGSNFDALWSGEAVSGGGRGENIVSGTSGCTGGVIAFAENSLLDGWRIKFCDNTWVFDDGPGTISSGFYDLQGIMAHEYGHALGLGHSTFAGATMFASAASGSLGERSIGQDDVTGVRAIYGVLNPAKPIISSIDVSGVKMVIHGSNFAASDVDVWFTNKNITGSGVDPRVRSFSRLSSNGGTEIALAIPANARPGDVMVRNPGSSGGNGLLSNAFPSDHTDTVGGLSFSISSITPNMVDALVPGTDQTVTITGTGLSSITSIILNQVSEVLPSSYTIVDDNTITIDLPQASGLGAATLRFSDGGSYFNFGFTVVVPAEPKLQLGTGVDFNATANGNDLRVLTSGIVGTQHRVFFSTSPIPSSVPILTLQFGNQFAEIFQGPTFTIPTEGYFEHLEMIVGITAPTVFYAQSVDISSPVSPDFDVSNLQIITLIP